ncbi:hypothetical protein [Desulfosporosinus sp. BG]|uniref:hypothetical protein n=1 Tax=Desulfosporosinus sp. BG TaxID=1633135 RepID=UPI00083B3626|nr:hypothetical protein [Desulfosporosinus sp. BG]
MEKQNKIPGFSSKPWILVGILLMIVSIGTVGCSSSKATTAQSTNQGQPGQGQRVRNPALTAAMEIRRLENDQQNPLTSDQKEKLKPILQELINTPNASQDILQQKADAINAVFTDQQKSSLTTRRAPNGNSQNANNSNENSSKGNYPQGGSGSGNGSGNGGRPTGSGLNPQDMYQQVLDSLK